MDLLPFGKLNPYRPRHFVPADADLGNWENIAPYFDELERRAARCKTTAELEWWLLEWSELSAALDQESACRYIAMTCHTDNQEAKNAYLHFIEKVDPELKPRQFKLAQIYVQHPARSKMPKPRYEVFDRDTKLHVELFRPENVPLETEEAKLGQTFQELSGSLTVQFQGEERTLQQMARFLEETDRAVRQQAWELVANRRLQEADKFDEIFDKMIGLRQQIAQNAGFSNYRDYAFRRLGRFDYTPEDCAKFHDAIASEIVPLLRDLHRDRKAKLQVDALRPWDTAVDPLNRPPLRPFDKVDRLIDGTQKIFDRLGQSLAQGFQTMREKHLLDLENRKGKAPGGYQSTLSEARLPFIFYNAFGVQRDVEGMLHEAGHAFHALATQEEDLYGYRNAPIEFCEVASMSMELLGAPYLNEFYKEEEANRARRKLLEGIIDVFPWIATVDAFQHWIYTHPGHTREERSAAWVQLMERFGGGVDWSGYERARANLWHRQLHIFLYPFYYIEYAIAQLGALQVWANSKQDHARALAEYHKGLSLGGSRPLPELFAAAGCKFDFSQQTVKPLIQMLRTELQKIG